MLLRTTLLRRKYTAMQPQRFEETRAKNRPKIQAETPQNPGSSSATPRRTSRRRLGPCKSHTWDKPHGKRRYCRNWGNNESVFASHGDGIYASPIGNWNVFVLELPSQKSLGKDIRLQIKPEIMLHLQDSKPWK